MSEKRQWWRVSVDELCRTFKTDDTQGLSTREAHQRLQTYGPNDVPLVRPVSPLVIFFKQFWSVVVLALFVAVLIAAAVGLWIDAISIGSIVSVLTSTG